MNKRIRELHHQVMLWSDTPDCPSESEWGSIPEEYTQKLAELIVRECAEAVENSIWHFPLGYKARDQAEFVKKHFGIEE